MGIDTLKIEPSIQKNKMTFYSSEFITTVNILKHDHSWAKQVLRSKQFF